MRLFVITLALLALIPLMYGCVKRDDVVGTYQALFPFVEITLILNKDGTYEHACKYTINDGVHEVGTVISQNGRWRLKKDVPLLPFYKVRLDAFRECCDRIEVNAPNSDPKAYITFYEVSKYRGSVKLIIRPDLNIFYKKSEMIVSQKK